VKKANPEVFTMDAISEKSHTAGALPEPRARIGLIIPSVNRMTEPQFNHAGALMASFGWPVVNLACLPLLAGALLALWPRPTPQVALSAGATDRS
jgi:hypothetical protein